MSLIHELILILSMGVYICRKSNPEADGEKTGTEEQSAVIAEEMLGW